LEISWNGTFGIEWMDDFIKWNTSANDDLLTLNLPANRVWIPKKVVSMIPPISKSADPLYV
jgi:hypothetical protein